MSLSAAKSRLLQAKTYFEGRRYDEIPAVLAASEQFLGSVPDHEAAPIRAELVALRAALDLMPTDEETRNLSAALGKIRQARDQLASGYLDVATTVGVARRHLHLVREIHRGEVAEDFARLELELAAITGGAPPAPPPPAPIAAPPPGPILGSPPPAATPAPAADAPLTDAEHADLSRGRSRVAAARLHVESGRLENVEATLAEAAAFLANVRASATAALRAQIDEVRAGAREVEHAETRRRATSELDRHLSGADSMTEMLDGERATTALDHVAARLRDDDVTAALSTDELAIYRDRVAYGRRQLAAAIKAEAFDRARPLIAELEARTATDPLVGLDQLAAYRAVRDLRALKTRVLDHTRAVPADDPELAALLARLTAVDQAVDRASAAWSKATLDAAVTSTWSAIASEILGWEAEHATVDAELLAAPALPLTQAAIYRIRCLLADPETARIRAEHRGDPAIEAPYREAERVFAAAGDKLAIALGAVLAAAEHRATPLRQDVLDRPALLALDAETALAGTPHAAPLAARARALDARWKGEVAAIMRERQALFDELAATAELAWPAIRDATGAAPFDPQTARPGTVVRLDEVYNRSGWDYAGRDYDFAVNVHGVVIAGAYAPHVRAALEHAWYEQKLEVTDRFPWDLVAIVEGPGKIGERTKVTLRDARTRAELGIIEQWPPIDCLRVRVVALHAGPVAVGSAGPGRN